MLKFNQVSKNFSHVSSSTCNQNIENFVWEYNRKNSMTFYIDSDIQIAFNDNIKHDKKFLWTLESPNFNGGVFDVIKNNLELTLNTFELIFTYNDELLKLDSKFKWVPAMGSWIKSPKIHIKNKLISMITSNKTLTEQQIFRNNFANSNINKIDVFGRGFKEITDKEIGLSNYMFSVCVENETFDTYFTEKILDCFATGTIPIYKGTKKILNHFNPEGIIFLDDINIENLNEDLYFSMLNAVTDNFERVRRYMCPENYFFSNYIQNNYV
jgi:hypothetical protein